MSTSATGVGRLSNKEGRLDRPPVSGPACRSHSNRITERLVRCTTDVVVDTHGDAAGPLAELLELADSLPKTAGEVLSTVLLSSRCDHAKARTIVECVLETMGPAIVALGPRAVRTVCAVGMTLERSAELCAPDCGTSHAPYNAQRVTHCVAKISTDMDDTLLITAIWRLQHEVLPKITRQFVRSILVAKLQPIVAVAA